MSPNPLWFYVVPKYLFLGHQTPGVEVEVVNTRHHGPRLMRWRDTYLLCSLSLVVWKVSVKYPDDDVW